MFDPVKFVADQKPLPTEFQKVLDDNYWELLATSNIEEVVK